ncbi:MAG: putative acetyltransferase [Ilumatobacteraceae bacterium]|nr:putative acetyltransferase [Ilumatobacteraceae bacterium]
MPCLPGAKHLLRSDRLVMRPMRHDDGDGIRETIDADVRRWQGYDSPAVEAMVAAVPVLASQKTFGCPYNFVVTEPNMDRPVGVYIVSFQADEPDTPTLGWWLDGSARGRGLGRESLGMYIGHLHSHLRFPVVRMATNIGNDRARAQIEAVGGVKTIFARQRLVDGSVVDGVWYEHEAGSTVPPLIR